MTLKAIPQDNNEPLKVKKPSKLDQCKSTLDPNIPGVETLLPPLPVIRIGVVLDWTRLHPDDTKYWSPELCFVKVPIKGQKRDNQHLIFEELAMRYLPSKIVKRLRLALAAKPNDVFFLCEVPSRNLDNIWNSTNLNACQIAQVRWAQATSRSDEGAEGYFVTYPRDEDAFEEPNWPKQSLDELIEISFNGRIIDTKNHPALLRLIGARQKLD